MGDTPDDLIKEYEKNILVFKAMECWLDQNNLLKNNTDGTLYLGPVEEKAMWFAGLNTSSDVSGDPKLVFNGTRLKDINKLGIQYRKQGGNMNYLSYLNQNDNILKYDVGGFFSTIGNGIVKAGRAVGRTALGLVNDVVTLARKPFQAFSDETKYVPDLHEGDSYKNSIVIDKGRQHLYAYDDKGNMTFNTPVTTGWVPGDKKREGDMRTPVGKMTVGGHSISNSNIEKFGTKDFFSVNTPGHSGIGIHGDVGYPWLIGAPASHGCIRMPNDSVPVFNKKVNPVGKTVYILNEFGNY